MCHVMQGHVRGGEKAMVYWELSVSAWGKENQSQNRYQSHKTGVTSNRSCVFFKKKVYSRVLRTDCLHVNMRKRLFVAI